MHSWRPVACPKTCNAYIAGSALPAVEKTSAPRYDLQAGYEAEACGLPSTTLFGNARHPGICFGRNTKSENRLENSSDFFPS